MIIVLRTPHGINPNNNNNVWEVTSDNSGLVYYDVTLINTLNDSTLINQRHYKKPSTNHTIINLTSTLKDLCESVLMNNNEIINYSKLPAYKMVIAEYYVNNDVITKGHEYIDNVKYSFFEGYENEIEYLNYTENKYNINTTTKAKFLTGEQPIKEITTQQKEYLKIFDTNNLAKKLKIMCYDADGDILGDVIIDILPLAGYHDVININVTPSLLLTHPNVIANTNLMFTQQFLIVLLNNNNEEVSESRLFIIKKSKCNEEETNLIFKNHVGGYDSVTLINRIETQTIEKKYLNSYKDNINNIFSNAKINYNVNSTYSYVASTNLLDDFYSKYLRLLLSSNKVYVALGSIKIETTIDNKSYRVMQRHVNGGKKNRIEIQFTTPFSISQLINTVNIGDVPLNNNPDNNLYLADNLGNILIDSYFNDVILKY